MPDTRLTSILIAIPNDQQCHLQDVLHQHFPDIRSVTSASELLLELSNTKAELIILSLQLGREEIQRVLQLLDSQRELMPDHLIAWGCPASPAEKSTLYRYGVDEIVDSDTPTTTFLARIHARLQLSTTSLLNA
ncbi:hypothetical protein KOI40_12790 [Aestuariicella sp. G3-2]|uniref:hypothetical protein n=1 Tax=Pseudomaricurvus albidus TaxID=2842452 RepID=UPI001C0D0164|nr:hypothetical protein [Aestuariicella albida]MBU3070702.1 hypothetical protein [Aestuariicella albida]